MKLCYCIVVMENCCPNIIRGCFIFLKLMSYIFCSWKRSICVQDIILLTLLTKLNNYNNISGNSEIKSDTVFDLFLLCTFLTSAKQSWPSVCFLSACLDWIKKVLSFIKKVYRDRMHTSDELYSCLICFQRQRDTDLQFWQK